MKKLQGELQREEGGKASLENTCLLLEHPARRHAGCRCGVTLNAGHDGRGLWREGGLPRQAFGTVGLLSGKKAAEWNQKHLDCPSWQGTEVEDAVI